MSCRYPRLPHRKCEILCGSVHDPHKPAKIYADIRAFRIENAKSYADRPAIRIKTAKIHADIRDFRIENAKSYADRSAIRIKTAKIHADIRDVRMENPKAHADIGNNCMEIHKRFARLGVLPRLHPKKRKRM
jgi:hypothetical protein